MELTFTAVDERQLGPKWQAGVRARPGRAGAPGISRKGGERRLGDAERQLRRHMPELVPVWRRQVELAGGDEVAARFLTFWNPPAYLVHCSQAVLRRPGRPDPGPQLRSRPAPERGHGAAQRLDRPRRGRDHGGHRRCGRRRQRGGARRLAGLRRPQGPRRGLRRAADRALPARRPASAPATRSPCCAASPPTWPTTSPWWTGRASTPPCSSPPDRPAEIARRPFATNHQRRVEWPEQARFSRTVERAAGPRAAAGRAGPDAGAADRGVPAPPLYASRHAEGFGTVYTAAYRPADAGVELRWPGEEPWRLSCDRLPRRQPAACATAGASAALPPDFAELARRVPASSTALRTGPASAGSGCTVFPQFAG